MQPTQALSGTKNIVRQYRKQMANVQAVQKQDASAKPTEQPKALPLKWLTDDPVWVGQWPMTSEKLEHVNKNDQEKFLVLLYILTTDSCEGKCS